MDDIDAVHTVQNHSSDSQELDEIHGIQDSRKSSTNLLEPEERVAEPPPEPSDTRLQCVDVVTKISCEPNVSNVLLELEDRTPDPHLWNRDCARASHLCITKTSSLNEINARQKRLNNLPELAETLSRPLGMALATVFHEVFEQNCDFRGVTSPNELVKILEAAFKESLFPVLGRERTVFLDSFKNSFTSSYLTISSVRRAYAKTESRRTPYPRQSLRESASNPWRVSSSQSHREIAKRNFENYNMDTLDYLKIRKGGESRASNSELESSFEDDILSFITTGNGQEDRESDGPCNIGKSCLNESLKSSFFTDSNHEKDEQSDTAGSCGKSSLTKNCEACSNSNGQDGHEDIIRVSSLTSLSKKSVMETQAVGREDSPDVDMFSATSSSESSRWLVEDGDDIIVAGIGPEQSGPSVSFKGGTFNQPAKRPAPQLAISQGPTDCTGSSGMLDDHTRISKVLQQERVPVIPRNSSDRNSFNRSIEHPADSLFQSGHIQFVTLGEDNANRKIPFLNPEPGPSRLKGELDYIGDADVSQCGNGESTLLHEGAGQVITGFTGAPLQDALLHCVPPFLKYGADPERHTLLQRYVEAQETKNYLKSLEAAYSRKRLSFKEDYLRLQSESNILMRENVDLSRSKAEFNEFKLEDRKLTAAHQELSQICADELVAGLCVMLFALGFAAWKFSYTRLSRIITVCELPIREPQQTGWLGTNWVFTTLNAFTWQLQSLTCELTKAGRMMAGLILIAFVTTSLVRRSVTSSSQSMPATIILVVLAGICGLAGKISVDSLGGSGFVWVILWELLCFLHAFAASCTPWLYRYLYGPSSKSYRERPSLWPEMCSILIRFVFHTGLVFALPVMAGLLPFASPEEVYGALRDLWEPTSFTDSM